MIDECEELFSKRDADHKAKNDITTVLLRFMDGLNEQSHTTIIGSTNVDKSLLDP
jgi:SpoVK/Ycf46/Vps4 family AAA+-type ATPase